MVGLIKNIGTSVWNEFTWLWKQVAQIFGSLRIVGALTLLSTALACISVTHSPQAVGMSVDRATLEAWNHRTAHDFAMILYEFHRELNPNSEARESHKRGLTNLALRLNARYRDAGFIPNDPRTVLDAALRALTGEQSDRDAIRDALLILEGYFSTFDGRDRIDFDFDAEVLSAEQKVLIDNGIADFNAYAEQNLELSEDTSVENRLQSIEKCCDLGRRVSYYLFPVWDEYLDVATTSDMEAIDTLKVRLTSELQFTKQMAEATDVGPLRDHLRDVEQSVQRRIDTITALQNNDLQLLREIVLKSIDKEHSKWLRKAIL